MNDTKKTGSYYTPKELVQFMVDYLEKEKQNFSDVLEPSAGDGRFLSLLQMKAEHILAIEIFKEKVQQLQSDYSCSKVDVIEKNFLDFVEESKKKYSLIIGNPPYINLKTMEKDDVEKARTFCEQEGLSKATMQNMWLAFVVGSVRLLEKYGSIFFVLPMEFLQVQYAEKLRVYLEKKFNTIHIISFKEVVFPEIEQDVCLVYLTNKQEGLPHILYEIYEDIKGRKLLSQNLIKKNKPLKKWSNAILSDEEISLIKEGSNRYDEISKMGEIAPGIVTGGNRFFILNQDQVERYECIEYTLPIVQKSSFIMEGILEIDEQAVEDLKAHGRPFYLLNLEKEKNMDELPDRLKQYLEWAGNEKVQGEDLKNRYKCANRDPWYGVPIVNKGDVVFFKRYHKLPRIFVNKAQIHTTDAGYHIRLKSSYDANSFVFCFFNSMTLAQCEYNGRYYGGGVSELVPSEFKQLVLPYRKIEQSDIQVLQDMFRTKTAVENIVAYVNSKTIERNFTKEEVEQFERIRQKLMKRREK